MTELVRQYSIANDDGVILLCIVMFALYAFVLNRSRSTLLHKWVVFFSSRNASGGENVNDTETDIQNNIILLVILSLSSGMLFFDRLSNHPATVSFGKVFTITGLLLAWIVGKAIAYWIVNWVFADFDKCAKWNSAFFYITSIFAIIVFPLSVFKIFFQPDCSTVFFMSLIMLAMYKILLFCKLTIIFRPKKYGVLLIFLYFCTLELMPVFLCWRIVV